MPQRPQKEQTRHNWGEPDAEALEHSRALFDSTATDSVRNGRTSVPAIVADYLARAEAANLPEAAVVRAAEEGLRAEAATDEDAERDLTALHEAAVEAFGPPETSAPAHARLRNYIHASTLPDWLYRDLPEPLAKLCGYFTEPEVRDVFLHGALGSLSASLPFLTFWYGEDWSRSNLYICVVAESGGGKKALEVASRLPQRIHEYLLEQSEEARHEWEDAQEDPELKAGTSRVIPPFQYLAFGGNFSDRELFDSMYTNGGYALIRTSEIKSLASTLGKEWGDARPVMLQGWENEGISVNRKEQRPLHITRPELNMVMSGTPESFAELIQDNEDGLFNRTTFYTFPVAAEWRSPFRGKQSAEARDEAIGHFQDSLLDAHRLIVEGRRVNREHGGTEVKPVVFTLSPDQEQRLDRTFEAQKAAMWKQGWKPLATYAHRTAKMAVRIACVLTALRRFAEGNTKAFDLDTRSVRVDDRDFRVGLAIGASSTAHGVELAKTHFRNVESPIAGEEKTRVPRDREERKAVLLKELAREYGDTVFMTGDLDHVFARIGVKNRTGRTYLAELAEADFLRQPVDSPYGSWRLSERVPRAHKVQGTPFAGVPDVPVGFVPTDLLFPGGMIGPESGDGVAGAEPEPVAAPTDDLPPAGDDAPF